MTMSHTADDLRADPRETASYAPGLLWPMLFPYRAPMSEPVRPAPRRDDRDREMRRQDAQLRVKSP